MQVNFRAVMFLVDISQNKTFDDSVLTANNFRLIFVRGQTLHSSRIGNVLLHSYYMYMQLDSLL